MEEILTLLSRVIHYTLIWSTPLILAALGGMFSERSGVVNIGLEGLMVVGAFTAATVSIFTENPFIGIIAAAIVGVIFALPHAAASVSFKADQVVSGVALNFLAVGFAIFMVKILFGGSAETTTIPNPLAKIDIPVLAELDYVGGAFFSSYPTTYIAIVIVIVSYFVLFKTPFGLRLRSVGEHPHAADTMGINVTRMRYYGVMISGALAGLGGAALVLTTTTNFSHTTVAGQGFMALAALIFGKWHPIGAMGAAIFFGLAQTLSATGQVLGLTQYVHVDILRALPYILTILALAGFVGRANAPTSLGKPYERNER